MDGEPSGTSRHLTPAGPVSPLQMAGLWERAMCDLAAAAASPAICLFQALRAANVDTGAFSTDDVVAARVGYGT